MYNRLGGERKIPSQSTVQNVKLTKRADDNFYSGCYRQASPQLGGASSICSKITRVAFLRPYKCRRARL